MDRHVQNNYPTLIPGSTFPMTTLHPGLKIKRHIQEKERKGIRDRNQNSNLPLHTHFNSLQIKPSIFTVVYNQ